MRLPSYQDLSKEQDRVNNLPLDGSHLVVGPPGTGKTVMALYRAQRLHRRGDPVQVIMHSRLLSQYTDSAIRELGINGVVTTFHSWFATFYRHKYGESAPEVARFVYDWDAILHTLNTSPPAAGELPYLIVDEGQDLPKGFYALASHLATNLTVFADENQRINDDNSTLMDISVYGGFDGKRHALTRNYRNTKEIARLAGAFAVNGDRADEPTRTGDVPQWRNFGDLRETAEFIARFEKANSDLEIGVFTPTKVVQRAFASALRGKTRRPVQLYAGGQGRGATVLDFESPGIKIVNYPSTKGLEFDAVFIPELQIVDGWQTELTDMKLYVMLSRAREALFLSHSGLGEPRLKARLPKELIAWK